MQRSLHHELLDQPDCVESAVLAQNLRDMARYNRWLGVHDLMLAQVRRFSVARTGLDVGIGFGDFVSHARMSLAIRWVGIDMSRRVLRCAQEAGLREPVAVAGGQQLPFADRSIDVVTSAHVLHHLDPESAIVFLRECARVARLGVVVMDIARSSITLAGAWLLTRATSRNRLTRADGVQSARRAYTLREAVQLARDAGWQNARATHHGPMRFSLVLEIP